MAVGVYSGVSFALGAGGTTDVVWSLLLLVFSGTLSVVIILTVGHLFAIGVGAVGAALLRLFPLLFLPFAGGSCFLGFFDIFLPIGEGTTKIDLIIIFHTNWIQ